MGSTPTRCLRCSVAQRLVRLAHNKESVGSTPIAAMNCGDSVMANISVSKTDALGSSPSPRVPPYPNPRSLQTVIKRQRLSRFDSYRLRQPWRWLKKQLLILIWWILLGAVGKLVKPLDFQSGDCGFKSRRHFFSHQLTVITSSGVLTHSDIETAYYKPGLVSKLGTEPDCKSGA